MKNRVALALASLLLAGCFEVEDEWVINPDGSGKVTHRVVVEPWVPGTPGEPAQVIKKELDGSAGIAAWSDVSAKALADGRIAFKGTAYFPDVTKVDLKTGFHGLHAKRSKGGLVLTMAKHKDSPLSKTRGNPLDMFGSKKKKKKLSLAAQRKKYQRFRGFFASLFSGMKSKIVFRLPGTVDQVNNFTKASDGAYTLSLSGDALLKAIDTLAADDAFLRQGGMDGPKDAVDMGINKMLFGNKNPVRLRATGGKPLFDYKTELAAAKKQAAKLETTLGLKPKVVAPPKGEGDLSAVRLGGLRYLHSKKSFPFEFFGVKDPHVRLHLTAMLPATALEVTGGRVLTALSAGGTDLRLEQTKIERPSLDKDKRTVKFQLPLKLPPGGGKGFKEVAGYLDYAVGGKTTQVDLGFGELKKGQTGKQYSARIEKIEKGWRKGSFQLNLVLKGIKKSQVAKVSVTDAKGAVVRTDLNGGMSMMDQTHLWLLVRAAVPPKGKVVLTVYAKRTQHRAHFKLTPHDLVGLPVK